MTSSNFFASIAKANSKINLSKSRKWAFDFEKGEPLADKHTKSIEMTKKPL